MSRFFELPLERGSLKPTPVPKRAIACSLSEDTGMVKVPRSKGRSQPNLQTLIYA